jgi:TonB family protein
MFSRLPESLPAPQRRRLTIAASTLVHATILWSGAHLTAAARTVPVRRTETIPYYIPVHHPEQTPQFVVHPHTGPSAPEFPVPVIDPMPVALPSPLPIPTAPDQWPDRHTGAGPADTLGPGPASNEARGTTSQPFAVGEVDRAAAPRPGAPAPVYPTDLQTAGIEGVVSVEFVVDSSGRADARHITIVSSDYPAFSAAARDVIVRTRYFPAEAHGHRVAQLVEQSFVFRITR